MKYDLVVADFDGTLGVAPDYIDPETVKTVKEYIARGGKFVICSGRMFSSIHDICMKYSLTGLVIAYQGAMINEIGTKKPVFSGGINYKLAAKVTKELLDEGIQTVADIDDVLLYEKSSNYTDYYEKAVHVQGKKVDDLVQYILDSKKDTLKVGGITDAETAKRLTQKYQKKYKGKLIINNGSPLLIEVVNPKCSKGEAVKFLAKYYNIPFEKIMTIGDSTNDIELLSGEWFGVAVGDGREELKAVADEITVAYKDRPVKYLLEKYCL